MRDAGITVETGVLQEKCRRSNEIFLTYITEKRPFLVMKTAMTLDGKIAAYTGDSKWVSGEPARRMVHKMRDSLTGIMVGIGTVLEDDPALTCRIKGGRDPLRIIVDSRLSIPLSAKVLKDDHFLIAATEDCDPKKRRELGKNVIITKALDGKVDLKELMKQLGQRRIDSILLEGGGTLNEAALRAGIVDRVAAFIAPKIIGGKTAKTPVEGRGIEKMSQAICLEHLEIKKIGEDLMIQGTPERRAYVHRND